MKLYHYTCRDAAPLIEKQRWLEGHPHPFMPEIGPLVHLTDLDTPVRDALGLTSNLLTCDRTEYRVTVVTDKAVHWPVFARTIPQGVRWSLENADGALPMHWYVAVDELIPVLAIEAVAR